MSASGSDLVALNVLVLEATSLPQNAFGFFLTSGTVDGGAAESDLGTDSAGNVRPNDNACD